MTSFDLAIIRVGWRPSTSAVLKMCLDVAKGMAYLHTAFNDQSNSHTQPIIHRDLKSANLLLATNPQLPSTGAEDILVKISDFGLCRSKALKGRQWDPHTAQMTNCGSMLWTAPEILANESCEQHIMISIPAPRRFARFICGC